MDDAWFWESNGERCGPVSEDRIREMLEQGEIGVDSLVWCEGMEDWAPLSSTDLNQRTRRPPPLPERKKSPPNLPATGSESRLIPVESSTGGSSIGEPIHQPVPNPAFRPRFRSSLARAWGLWKTDFWPFLGLYALMSVLFSVVMQVGITAFFLSFPIMVGFSWYVLKRVRGRQGSVDDLFFGFKRRFGDLAILNLIVSIPLLFATLLVFIPPFGFLIVAAESDLEGAALAVLIGGFVFAAALVVYFSAMIQAVASFASLLIVDCDMAWREAWRLAWRVTKPRILKLALVYLAFLTLPFFGLLALYVGAFFLGCWVSMALTFLYEDAFGGHSRS